MVGGKIQLGQLSDSVSLRGVHLPVCGALHTYCLAIVARRVTTENMAVRM